MRLNYSSQSGSIGSPFGISKNKPNLHPICHLGFPLASICCYKTVLGYGCCTEPAQCMSHLATHISSKMMTAKKLFLVVSLDLLLLNLMFQIKPESSNVIAFF